MSSKLKVLSFLLLCVLVTAQGFAAGQSVQELNQAYVQFSDYLPDRDYAKTGDKVSLPHGWNERERTSYRFAWYSFSFNSGSIPGSTGSGKLLAVYIPRAILNVQVFVNGQLVGQDGEVGDGPDHKISYHWNQPYYFTIPLKLLRSGQNTLQVRVVKNSFTPGYLSRVYIGPDSVLLPVYRKQVRWQNTGVKVVASVMFMVGIIFAVLWLLHRRDHTYGWFALGVIFWAGAESSLVATESMLPERIAITVGFMSIFAFAFCLSRFMECFTGLKVRLVLWLQSTAGVLMLVTLLAVPDADLVPAAKIWVGITGLAAPYGLYLLFSVWRRTGRRHFGWMFVITTVIGGMAAHDIVMNLSNFATNKDVHLMVYTAPFFVAFYSLVLIVRFVQLLNRVENINEELEERVVEKTSELKHSYEKLKLAENQRILAEERSRIMSDMHDGFGGQLVTAIAMIDNESTAREDVRKVIQYALDDLRLMIDALSPDEDLPTLLGMLRSRIGMRFEQAGIRINWDVPRVSALNNLGPHKTLQVLRIVQEALTNTLKHANAENLYISAGESADQEGGQRFFVEVRDDGQGIDVDKTGGGRGLTSINRRAHAIDAELDINSDADGTRVRLLFAA